MSAIVAAEGKRGKGPKTLSHLEIHPQLGGGHVVRHVYHGYDHQPRDYKFEKTEASRAAAHIARHVGLPLATGNPSDLPNESVD